jgi:DNA-binding NarL/FixJ family response regulator
MDELRVLIADDHPIVRQGLRAMLSLEKDLRIVGEAADGEEVVALAQRLEPDIVLMDVRMAKLNGIAATQRIKEMLPKANVLILTNYDDDEYIIGCIKAGASGYLLKDVPPGELVKAIRTVAQGYSLAEPVILRKMLAEATRIAQGQGKLQKKLTAREQEILQALVSGLSNREIAEQSFITERTVKSHLSNIYEKLGVHSRGQAIVCAVKDRLVDLSKI